MGIGVTESMKAKLDSIGMQDAGHFEGENSSTSFFGILVVFIFWSHLLAIENAELFFKSWTVKSH